MVFFLCIHYFVGYAFFSLYVTSMDLGKEVMRVNTRKSIEIVSLGLLTFIILNFHLR